RKKGQGISLIVLVITIVIMIILAGTIILSLNSSNIISKAKEAATKTNTSNAKQVAILAKIEYDFMSEEDKETITLRNYIKNKLEEAGLKDQMDNVIDEEGNLRTTVDGVIIPKGFYHVGGTKEEGLVISDNEVDKGRGTSYEVAKELQGNQLVWVPVENINEFIRYDFRSDTTPSNDLNEITPEAGKDREVEKMYKSVEKYQGFYVARYEGGIASGMSKPTSTTIALADGINKPRIKQGLNVWNYIPWGGTQDDMAYDWYAGDDNANGAVKVARSLYSDNIQNTKGLVSHLIYGVQWDAIMRWYKNSNINVQDSSDYGNYLGGGGLKVTGSEEAYQKKNIYDLAGNVYEWTMEAYSWNGRVSFGGNYSSRGSITPVSARALFSLPYVSDDTKGFRIVAYIK
ncbi:MAG: hypothetical protein WC313_05885, partial [Candidatus Kapaibacterium sp.]